MQGQVDFTKYWLNELHALESNYRGTIQKYPDSEVVLNQVYGLSGSIASLTRSTPGCVVNSDSWQKIVNSAKEAQVNLCRALEGKWCSSGLYRTCTVMLQDLQALAKSSQSKPDVTIGPSTTTAKPNEPAEVDCFCMQRRRKKTSSGELEAKKRVGPRISAQAKTEFKAGIRNYFTLLRLAAMDCTEL
jgi:hypothetical protein